MISSLKFNRHQLHDRKKMFDKDTHQIQGSYRSFEDHKKMKGIEFAAFQKRMFHQLKKDRKRRRLLLLVTIIITFLVIFGFLYFWNIYDFRLLESSVFH